MRMADGKPQAYDTLWLQYKSAKETQTEASAHLSSNANRPGQKGRVDIDAQQVPFVQHMATKGKTIEVSARAASHTLHKKSKDDIENPE